jgi:mannitol operon repressor
MTEPDDDRRLPLAISHPHLAEFSRFLPELNKESDRGRVMISCSYLDELMRRTLLGFFIDRETSLRLDGFNAPLGTFSTRTAATFALGLRGMNK